MKTLLIMRHAKSSWDDETLGDQQRPLNKRGRRDAPRMGKLLRKNDLTPQAILCSTAERTRQTALATAEAGGFACDIQYEASLYGATIADYLAVLRNLPDKVQVALVVGHNPGVEDLVAELTGEDEKMPTAAVARVALSLTRWSDLNLETEGKLEALWRPKKED